MKSLYFESILFHKVKGKTARRADLKGSIDPDNETAISHPEARTLPLATKETTPVHRWKVIDGVLVSQTIPGEIRDATWQGFLDEVDRLRPRHWLMLCAGAINLDAAQRRRATLVAVRSRCTLVVMTDNRVTRGLAMTMAWFGVRLDAFSWGELSRGLERFEVHDDTRQRLTAEAMAFCERFAVSER